MLDPDIDQIEIFTDAMFRHAGKGFVSLRAFHERDAAKPYMISAVSVAGNDLRYLNERAAQVARQAANHSAGVVFCPPIAIFNDRQKAAEANLLEGLALSVECDQRPQEAFLQLHKVLGPATLAVESGGIWTDPATGQSEKKLHLHWRLKTPAKGKQLADLKLARDLACRLVGGDASNKTVVHPIRWPGSWHRKSDPIMCRIAAGNPDDEIDLAMALAALKLAAEQATPNGKAYDGFADAANEHRGDTDWSGLVANILAGNEIHHSITRLAAKMIASGMDGGAAVNMLRGFMSASAAPRDSRWQARYDEIQRAVDSAEQKYRRDGDGVTPAPPEAAKGKPSSAKILTIKQFLDRHEPPVYLVDALMQQGFFYSLSGNTGSGKSAIALLLCFCIVLGVPFGPHPVKKGRVAYIAKENDTDIRQRIFGMVEALGVDLDAIERDFLVIDAVGDLEKDLATIAKDMGAFGPVDLIVVDTSAATFSGDDENSNPQILAHALKQRKYCTIAGKPTTLSLCHPTKGATAQESLVPRGGGAFLNETDGNFTAFPYGEKLSDLHWTGKFRGPDFEKITFRFATVYPEKLKLPDGRLFPTVMAEIATEEQLAEAEEKAEYQDDRMLKALAASPGSSIANLAKACGWILSDSKPNKGLAQRVLNRLLKVKLVEKEGEGQATRYTLTNRGRDRAKQASEKAVA